MIRLKTPEEIEILREGGKRHAAILKELTNRVKPGVSTGFLEDEALRLIGEGGDEPAFLGYRPAGARRKFPASLCVSINDEIVHGIPNERERIIQNGDIVSLDLGIIHKGLITDAAVTVPAGETDETSKKLIETTRKALMAGIRAAKLGARIGDIGAAISRVAKGTGFSIAEDLVGHGVGFEVHEDPYVPNVGTKNEGEQLVAGMVLALEPMLNVGTSKIKISEDGYTIRTRDGSRSAHFEHTIAITEKGTIIITQ